ncbi:hypothetical protein FO499_16020 [Bacillus anthracis]|nr:hypothetical protein GBN83_27205 [Bacillus sp. B3-WWTP-C-10-D-3]MDR4407975.1 hypothetical protein [Bacillus anthracis]
MSELKKNNLLKNLKIQGWKTVDKINDADYFIKGLVAKGVDETTVFIRGEEVLLDGSVRRYGGTNFSESVKEAHDASKASIQSRISNLESGGVKGTGNSKIQLGKEDLDALRKKWNVPETNTIAVGKTDVKGLRDLAFEGGSPEVRKEAGLPSLDTILPNREIRAPYDHLKNPKLAQFTRHAEEGVLNEFDYAIKKAGIEPTEVTGTLRIHQSNPRGVCNKCSKGLLKPHPIEKSGIFYQASKKYPNLTIEVTSEIDGSVKTNGLLSFVLKDGKIIE